VAIVGNDVEIHRLSGGEIVVWVDQGVIMIKTCEPHGDPVELSEDEAMQLSDLLRRLAAEQG
jgi:hypothetical protein